MDEHVYGYEECTVPPDVANLGIVRSWRRIDNNDYRICLDNRDVLSVFPKTKLEPTDIAFAHYLHQQLELKPSRKPWWWFW